LIIYKFDIHYRIDYPQFKVNKEPYYVNIGCTKHKLKCKKKKKEKKRVLNNGIKDYLHYFLEGLNKEKLNLK